MVESVQVGAVFLLMSDNQRKKFKEFFKAKIGRDPSDKETAYFFDRSLSAPADIPQADIDALCEWIADQDPRSRE